MTEEERFALSVARYLIPAAAWAFVVVGLVAHGAYRPADWDLIWYAAVAIGGSCVLTFLSDVVGRGWR